MTGDQPLITDFFVRERVTRLDLGAIRKTEGIQSGVRRRVAVDFYQAIINAALGPLHQKVREVVFLFRNREARAVGHRW